jgi:hypothetical protein
MTQITGSVVYADVPGYPEGSVVDHILVTLTASGNAANSQSASVAPGTASVSFDNVQPDTYTASVQAFPATGAGYGTAVASNSIMVAAPVTVTLSLPASLVIA